MAIEQVAAPNAGLVHDDYLRSGQIEMQPINFVLLWHMHQPDYRNYETGEFMLPWVYLHAIKDYTDMVSHLEAHPSMKAVVNFVPVLLDQLEDYAAQFAMGVDTGPAVAFAGNA